MREIEPPNPQKLNIKLRRTNSAYIFEKKQLAISILILRWFKKDLGNNYGVFFAQ
jgi:hypothetical protein